jgi:hypothetical protein
MAAQVAITPRLKPRASERTVCEISLDLARITSFISSPFHQSPAITRVPIVNPAS